MKEKKLNNYWLIFGLLIFIFLIPLIIAFMLFNKNPNWLHLKTVNKGTLISTNLNLQQLKLIPSKITLGSFKPTWSLFYLIASPCRELCQNHLYQMHQIILALGKYRHLVQYGLILAEDKPRVIPPFPNKDKDLLNYTIAKQYVQKIFLAFNSKGPNAAYFIADPFGKIILYYPNNVAGEDIYQDLMRLLTISTTG